MKFANIAISVALVVGAVVAGGSWYTGKQVEQHYIELVEKANENLKSLKSYGFDAQFKEVQLERGWFSSTVKYNLSLEAGNEKLQFNGQDKLYHGPLPFNRLIKGDIAPMMASIESNISVPENWKSFFSESTFLSGQGDLSYAQTWRGNYKSSPVTVSEIGLMLSEMTYQGEVAKDGSGSGKLVLPQFKIRQPDDDTSLEITFDHLEYDFAFDSTLEEYSLLNLGQSQLKAKSILFKDLAPTNELTMLELSDVVSDTKNRLNDDQVKSQSDFSGKLALGSQKRKVDLGKLRFEITANADAKLTNELLNYFTHPETLEQHSEQVMNSIFKLLSKGVKFHLTELSLENSQGKSHIALLLNAVDGNSLTELNGLEDILKLLKQSKLTATLNLAMAQEMVKQLVDLHPELSEGAEQIAKSEIENWVELAKQSEFAVVDTEDIQVNLYIDQGNVKLNNQDASKEQVQGVLFMLMLILSNY